MVGIGGSGKTAIAERFLQVIPFGYAKHPKVSKDADLPALGTYLCVLVLRRSESGPVSPKRPLTAMSDANRDAAWVDVCKATKDTIAP